jgi:hypothetical protein
MKTLVYGMQSSGASLFAYFLAQRRESIGVIDLYHDRLAPDLHSRHDIILKCTINNSHSLRDHQRSFRPDVSILFVRDPVQNAIRLATKPWKEFGGTVREKLALMNDYLANWKDHFDFVVTYEDFLYRRAAIVELLHVDSSYYSFPRSVEEVVQFSCAHSAWCRETYRSAWGTGDIRSDAISLIATDIQTWCPEAFELYAGASPRSFTRRRGSASEAKRPGTEAPLP